jgi:hypothetical protein
MRTLQREIEQSQREQMAQDRTLQREIEAGSARRGKPNAWRSRRFASPRCSIRHDS